MLDQSTEIEKFWCSNSRYPGVIQWNGDRRLVVERVEVKLSACVHCLHLDCDQEQPKKARRNPSVGFCTRGPGHTIFEISRSHLSRLAAESLRKPMERQSELIYVPRYDDLAPTGHRVSRLHRLKTGAKLTRLCGSSVPVAYRSAACTQAECLRYPPSVLSEAAVKKLRRWRWQTCIGVSEYRGGPWKIGKFLAQMGAAAG